MKKDKIIYGESIQVSEDHWKKFGIEATLEDGDNVQDCYDELKKDIQDAYKKSTNVPDVQRDLFPPNEPDPEFEQLKKDIDTLDSKESALKFLDLTNFRFSFEAKQYINSKFN